RPPASCRPRVATGRPVLSFPVMRLAPVDDLAAGGEPDVLARGDVRQCLGKILRPVRMADQEWMRADRHHAAGLGAVLIKHVELIADHLSEPLRALMQA